MLREDLSAGDEAEGVVVGAGQVVAPERELEVAVAQGEPCVEQGVEGLRDVVLACPVDASHAFSDGSEGDVLQPAAGVPGVAGGEGCGVAGCEGYADVQVVAVGILQGRHGVGEAVGGVDGEGVGDGSPDSLE